MTAPLRYLTRQATPEDHNFIVHGWVKEMRHAPWTRHVPNGVYLPAQHALAHQVLAGSSAIVACDPDNPAHLYGAAVYVETEELPRVVHWLYVKGAYRGLGVGRALLLACFEDVVGAIGPIACTQASQLFEDRELVERYNLVYSPYLLLGIPLPSPGAPAPGATETANG